MFEIGQEVTVEIAIPGLDATITERHRIIEIDGETATTVTAYPMNRFDLQHTYQFPFAQIQVQCQHIYWDEQQCLDTVWQRSAPPQTLPARYCLIHAVHDHGHCGILLTQQIALYALISDRNGTILDYATTRHSVQDTLEALRADGPNRVTAWAVHLHSEDAQERLDIDLRSLLGQAHDTMPVQFGGGMSEPYCGRMTSEVAIGA